MSKELTDALAAAAASPCTGYSCPKQADCANEKLACESFVYYVNTGRAVHPLMMFKEMKVAWRPINDLKSHHAPTRKLYNRVFKDEIEPMTDKAEAKKEPRPA